MMVKQYICLIALLSLVNSFGQDLKKEKYFPIWTYHQKKIDVNGISLGLGSFGDKKMNTNTNGIKVELIGMGILLPLISHSPISQNDTITVKSLQESASERINGVVLSSAGTGCDCKTNGVILGVVGHLNTQVNGVSAALFMNLAQKHNGIQLSLFNESYYMSGIQLGLTNYSTKPNGLQVGLYNIGKKLKGLQIGLWNVNAKRKLPILNWNFKD